MRCPVSLGVLLPLLLIACGDKKKPSDAWQYVQLKSELADTIHVNLLDCDQMADEIDAWFAKNGEAYRALDQKAASGNLKARLGDGLLGKNIFASTKINTYTEACASESPKLVAVMKKHF